MKIAFYLACTLLLTTSIAEANTHGTTVVVRIESAQVAPRLQTANGRPRPTAPAGVFHTVKK